jgi:hypothetical protein
MINKSKHVASVAGPRYALLVACLYIILNISRSVRNVTTMLILIQNVCVIV